MTHKDQPSQPGEEFGKFLVALTAIAMGCGLIWMMVTGWFWILAIVLFIVGIFGAILKVAAWGLR